MLRVVREFQPCDAKRLKVITATIVQIATNYRLYLTKRPHNRSLQADRRKLDSLVAAARKLRAHMNDYKLLNAVFLMQIRKLSIEERRREAWKTINLDNFITALDLIESGGAELANDESALRSFRAEPMWDGGKTAECLLIWEPLFLLRMACGHRLGFSKNGPLMRALEALHGEFGLAAPKSSAIQEAQKRVARDRCHPQAADVVRRAVG